MLIVGTDAAAVETDLIGGRLGCPDCASALRPWGHSVEREVRLLERSERRRFRRSICRSCAVTHVLVPEDTLVRRRDGVEVIGAALAAKATGRGPPARSRRTSAGRPSTVRGWLRRFAAMASELREHFTRWAHALDPGHDRLFARRLGILRRRRGHRRARDRGGPPLRSPPAVVARLGRHRRRAALQHELTLGAARVSGKGHLFTDNEEVPTR